MLSDMGNVEFYMLCALLVGFLIGSIIEGNGKRKLSILLCFVCISLLSATDAFAGSKKYNSKGRAKPPPQTVMQLQEKMDWLAAGCPPLIQAPQPQPKQPAINVKP